MPIPRWYHESGWDAYERREQMYIDISVRMGKWEFRGLLIAAYDKPDMVLLSA